jgi:hypothetical protein
LEWQLQAGEDFRERVFDLLKIAGRQPLQPCDALRFAGRSPETWQYEPMDEFEYNEALRRHEMDPSNNPSPLPPPV